MQTIELTKEARSLLLACYSGVHVLVDDDNRNAYRELAEAGMMTPLHTPLGRNSAYRMTEAGVSAASNLGPSPAKAPLLHG